MTEIAPTPPVEFVEPDPTPPTYLVVFNSSNYQINFVKNDPIDIEMMARNGIDTSSWIQAPPEFVPDQSICINDAGIARIATPSEINYKIGYNEQGVQITYYLVNVGEPQLTTDFYLRAYLDAPSGFGDDNHFFSLINTQTDEKYNLNSIDTSRFYQYCNDQIDLSVVPLNLQAVFEQCKKNKLINNFLPAINEKKDELIQTISANFRTIILGSEKTESKYYIDTWQNFYQRCQNIRFNPTLEVSDIQRTTANTIISNIDVFTEKKRLLILHMQTLTISELESFNPLDDVWWTV
jgi:hypothetical protein